MTRADAPGDALAAYAAARDGDVERARRFWEDARPALDADARAIDTVDTHLTAGDANAAADTLADIVYVDDETPVLDGAIANAVGDILHAFGYVAAFVLFFGAHSTETIVGRLRLAYRAVGVDIERTETVDGTERTVFRCPYRTLGADRYGDRRVCHDVLDRVDDGYVTFLARHRDIDYDRPRRCRASECCHSEVREE